MRKLALVALVGLALGLEGCVALATTTAGGALWDPHYPAQHVRLEASPAGPAQAVAVLEVEGQPERTRRTVVDLPRGATLAECHVRGGEGKIPCVHETGLSTAVTGMDAFVVCRGEGEKAAVLARIEPERDVSLLGRGTYVVLAPALFVFDLALLPVENVGFWVVAEWRIEHRDDRD